MQYFLPNKTDLKYEYKLNIYIINKNKKNKITSKNQRDYIEI